MGESHVLVLTGEPGIGKTTLLRAAEDLVGRMRLLRAQGTEAEQMIPFAALLQILRPLLDQLDRIPTAQAAALSSALLLRTPIAEPNRFAIGAATLSLIALAAENRPIALILDDVHLLDPPSADALIFAARRLGTDPVAIIAAARDDPGTKPWLALPTRTVGGVDPDATAELMAATGRPLHHDQLLRLHRATGGNPLALLELRVDIDRHGAPEEFPLPISEELSQAFLGRAATLDESARTALLVAAVDGSDLPTLSTACRLLGLTGPLLDAAEGLGLLTVDSGQVRFRHPLVRSAVYAAADPALRRQVHRALAAALPPTQTHRIAWHRAAAAVAPDEPTAALLDRAGDQAAQQGAHASAANAFQRAAALSGDHRSATLRSVRAAEASWAAGDAARTTELLDRALSGGPDPRMRCHIQELRGAVETRCGSLDHALSTFLDAAEAIAADDADSAIRLLSDATHVSFYLGAATSAQQIADQIIELQPRSRDPDAVALASMAIGMARTINGDGANGTELIRDAAVRLIAEEDLASERFRLPLRVQSALWMRDSASVRTAIGATIDRLRTEGALGSLPYLLMHIGRNAATSDSWDEAESAYREGIRLAGETGQTTDLTMALAGLACLLARRGDIDGCRSTIRSGEALAERNQIRLASFWLIFAAGDLAAGQEDPAAAAVRYEALQTMITELGFADPDQWCAPELIECYLQLGRTEQAEPLARDFLTLARAKGRPWSLARAERAVGLCTGVLDPDAAEDHFTAAVGWHRQTSDRYESARTLLAMGGWLRRARRRVDARMPLTAALRDFESLGARPWADRAARELAATGATVRRRTPALVDDLTPQERQIARLLVQGRTTREAAAVLFLSPKTVEYHLRHVYQKLGISSRTELAARLTAHRR